jgi:hypothetical protein
MELAFMAKLKTAVEHKDPALFADLMDFARTPDRKRILFVTSWEPFPSILSDRPRSYDFKRVTPPLSQENGTTIRTFDDPLQDANRDEVAEVWITFKEKSPQTQSSVECLPLVIKNGQLKIVMIMTVHV